MSAQPPERPKPESDQSSAQQQGNTERLRRLLRTDYLGESKKIKTKAEQRSDVLNLIRAKLEASNKKELSPRELMQLLAQIRKPLEGVNADEGSQSRYQEVTNAYNALEELQFILTGRVSAVSTETLTGNTLAFVGWLGDIASTRSSYERGKEMWWAKRINRPNKAESQEVKDFGLNSSYGNYVESYRLSESAYRFVHENQANMAGKNQLITGFAYEYLRELVIKRGQKTHNQVIPKGMEVVLPYAGIAPKNDTYTIIIHREKFAKKVQIPSRLINFTDAQMTPEQQAELYEEFHRLLSAELTEPLPTEAPTQLIPRASKKNGWVDTDTLRPQINAAEEHAKTGKENTFSARKRRRNPRDLTAADLAISIVREEEMKLAQLQQDYRVSNYGVAIPVSLAFGIDGGNKVRNLAAKYAHAYTDGAYAATEMLRDSDNPDERGVAARAFEHVKPPSKVFSERVLKQPETSAPVKEQTVWEVSFPREQFEDRINKLRTFFSDPETIQKLSTGPDKLDPHMLQKIAKGLSFQNLITLALMAAFNHPHAQFLEAVNPTPRQKGNPILKEASEMAPAIAVANGPLREGLKIRPIGPPSESFIFNLLTAVSSLADSRAMTKDGKGAGHIFGTILENDTFRNTMQGSGEILDTLKTKMLIDTVLVSQLVGGKEPLNHENQYLEMQSFTTAFSDAHHGEVFGACDRKGADGKPEISITLRRKLRADQERRLDVSAFALQGVPVIIGRILGYLEELQKDLPMRTESEAAKTKMTPLKGLREAAEAQLRAKKTKPEEQ